jgi:hypothetical protein
MVDAIRAISPIEVLIVCFGLVYLIRGLLERHSVTVGQNWPATDGVVRSFKTWKVSTEDDEMCKYHVEYEFSVNGQTYRSHRVLFGKSELVEESAMPRIEYRYQVGSSIQVFYNPQRPASAVLERRAPGQKTHLWMGVGILGSIILLNLFTLAYSGG